MIEIRFHGRGGQGAVTSAELLALAAHWRRRSMLRPFPVLARNGGEPLLWPSAGSVINRSGSGPISMNPIWWLFWILSAENRQCCCRIKTQRYCCNDKQRAPEKVKENSGSQKPDRSGGCNQDCHGNSRSPYHQYDHARVPNQGIRSWSRGSLLFLPLRQRFGRIAEKNISAFERAYQETVLTLINFYKKR